MKHSSAFSLSRLLPTWLLGPMLVLSFAAHAGEAEVCVFGEGQWGGGPAMGAERWSDVGEDLLLVGAGAELIVFDIATPLAPVELGRVLVKHPAVNVAVSADGQWVATSDNFDNLTLIDIGNRSAPQLRGRYAWPGLQQPTGMAFEGDHLYVAVRTIGLAVLDISDPDALAFVANSDGSATNFVGDVALHGDHAYLGQDADGVQVVDISDPANPTVVGNHAASVGASRIEIVDDRAYVTRGGEGFDILDLGNPVAPVHIGGFDTEGFTYDTALLPGNRLAVATSDGTVVFDIGTPATPLELGVFNVFYPPARLVALDARAFIIPGAADSSRVRFVDFQTPATPVELAHIDFDGRSMAVSVGVDHILVANNEGGVVMLDSTNPVAPEVVGRVDIVPVAQRVGHVNGHGVASPGYASMIHVIDPLPGGPAVVASIDNIFTTNDLVGVGTLLYVASGEFGGLRIYDMANPLLPALLGWLPPPGDIGVHVIAVAGDYVYYGSGFSGDPTLRVVDVSNPAAPVVVGSPFTLPEYAIDVAASGNTVVVGTDLHGVRILQHAGAGVLSEIADIDLSPAGITGVSIDGDRLYISAGVFSGLLVYDISDPASPQFIAQHNTAGDGQGVHASGGVVAMAEDFSGTSTFGCAVESINQAPVTVGIIGDQIDIEGDVIFPLSVHQNFDDPDGQSLTFSATGLPPGLAIGAGSGVVQGAPDLGSLGSYSVEVTATDPFGLSATQAFGWTIVDTHVFGDGFE